MASAKKLPSGNWRIQVFVGKNADGSNNMKSFTAPTRWEAEKIAAEFIEEGRKEKKKFTVAKAVDGYISLKSNVLSPSTIRGYGILRRNRLQSLMPLDIHEVNSFTMQQAINEDAATVSGKTINEAKNLILTALKLYGVKPDICVTLPAKKPTIKNLPTAEEFINIIRGTDIELPCLLAVWLSLRISEVRGLQFGDIGKDNRGTVRRSKLYFDGADHVRDVNKTFKSTRMLKVPPYLLNLINAVPHQSDDEFIVQMGYQQIRNHMTALLKAHDLYMTFHDLRHLNASVMLALGIPDKYAMERGGWATNSTLKNVYQHTFSAERDQVDEKIDNYFNGILGC